MSTRVLLVEDHDLLADTLSVALAHEGYEVHRPPGLDAGSVVAAAEEIEPRVVLLDLHLTGERSALPMIEPLREAGASVLVVTSERDRLALAECVEAGAIGLIHKSVPLEELIEAVHDVAELRERLSKEERDELLHKLHEHRLADEQRLQRFAALTAREQVVLAGLMEGLSADALATRDYVSVATIRSQIRSILSKLGVSSQLAAVAVARAADWRPAS